MFCRNCGAKLDDDSKFCVECGSKVLQETAPVYNNIYTETTVNTTVSDEAEKQSWMNQEPVMSPKKKGKGFKLLIPVAIILVVLAGVFFMFGARSEEKLIKQVVEAQYKADAEMMWKLIAKPIREMVLENSYYTEEELIEMLQEELDYSELDRGWTYEYAVTDTESATKSEIKEMNEELKDEGIKSGKISGMKELEVEVDIYDDYGDYYDTEYLYVTIIKIGRSWHLVSM